MSYGNPTCIRVIADTTGLPSLMQFWIPCYHQLHDLLFVSCTEHRESSQGEEKMKRKGKGTTRCYISTKITHCTEMKSKRQKKCSSYKYPSAKHCSRHYAPFSLFVTKASFIPFNIFISSGCS